MSQLRIGIIADDLTGATDIAAAFAAAGFRSAVALDPTQVGDFREEVLCLTTNSRQDSEKTAARKVRQAGRALVQAGFPICYKKLDSTAKGNILPETIALRDSGGFRRALLCTANPKQGRTVTQGKLWIRGKLSVDLGERWRATDREDILWVHDPITSARLARNLPHAPALWVCDAASTDDLKTLVDFAESHPGEFLLTGSAGLAVELANKLRQVSGGVSQAAGNRRVLPLSRRQIQPQKGAALLIIGSNDPVTAEQLEILTRDRPTLQLSTTASLPLCLKTTVEDCGAVILKLPVNQASSIALRRHLHPLRPWLRRGAFGSLLMSGGDTALLVCEWLGITGLEIGGELLPGLVWGRARGGSAQGLQICTKPGGFGSPDSLALAVDQLTRRKPAAPRDQPRK